MCISCVNISYQEVYIFVIVICVINQLINCATTMVALSVKNTTLYTMAGHPMLYNFTQLEQEIYEDKIWVHIIILC